MTAAIGVTADACPFNGPAYARGLTHLGSPRWGPRSGVTILCRTTPDGSKRDGVSPWPYLWLSGGARIAALRRDFSDLVSVAAVCQPGFIPPLGESDPVLLKQHYVYDPSAPVRPLSRRAQRRLDTCRERATFEMVSDPAQHRRIIPLYRKLVERRGLYGGYFDIGQAHFDSILALPDAVVVQVRSGTAIGAMACGVRFGDRLQILHLVPSDLGLTWDASYLLMAGLQEIARREHLQLHLGGLPATARPGLRTFKERWSNRTEPVFMLRIVNDADAYAALCSARRPSDYFSAYRSP